MTYSKISFQSHFVNVHTISQEHIRPNYIRIGPNYQVDIPEYQNIEQQDDHHDDSILMWRPDTDRVDDAALDVYLNEVKTNYGFDSLQALSLLLIVDYDVQNALNIAYCISN